MTITWEQILAFLCEDQSMAVTSLLFIAFFVAVALVHYLLPRVLRPYFLLAASYGFFCYDPVNRPLVGVLLGATAVSWLCGLIIGKVKVKPVRVLALLVTVLGGVGILVYYKYWNMLADTLGGSILSHRDNLLAPLGLSYFTFAAMSYTIDVYKRRCKVETNTMRCSSASSPRSSPAPLSATLRCARKFKKAAASATTAARAARSACCGATPKRWSSPIT